MRYVVTRDFERHLAPWGHLTVEDAWTSGIHPSKFKCPSPQQHPPADYPNITDIVEVLLSCTLALSKLKARIVRQYRLIPWKKSQCCMRDL
jgi:hypothetical protein